MLGATLLCAVTILGRPAAQSGHGTNPISLQIYLPGISAALPCRSVCVGTAPSCFIPGTASAKGIISSFLPNIAKTVETCRNGAKYLIFLQFGITRTHIHIKTIEMSNCPMLLFLTLLQTCWPEGDKLTPQTREFSHVSNPGLNTQVENQNNLLKEMQNSLKFCVSHYRHISYFCYECNSVRPACILNLCTMRSTLQVTAPCW